jgi:hypothetical protein
VGVLQHTAQEDPSVTERQQERSDLVLEMEGLGSRTASSFTCDVRQVVRSVSRFSTDSSPRIGIGEYVLPLARTLARSLPVMARARSNMLPQHPSTIIDVL